MSITPEIIKEDFEDKFLKLYIKDVNDGSDLEKYNTLVALIKDYAARDWLETNKRSNTLKEKEVYYFSMEFLLGRLLGDALLSLDIRDNCRLALKDLNIDLDKLEEIEQDQGLGNGGLGRLAACFLDSMAALNIAGNGCGIRYRHGFFEQEIVDGRQIEKADNWLKSTNPWEVRKECESEIVRFGGNVTTKIIDDKLTFIHSDYEEVLAIPYDTPVLGYKNNVVNTLRLWSSEPVNNEFDFQAFNRGDYLSANRYKNSIEAITEILYPEDSFCEGKLLRLKQEYFFVSAGVKSIIRKYKKNGGNILDLGKKVSMHINDTHPSLVIPELMRILIDEEMLEWQESWEITQKVVSYTNHTILSEALEKWPIDMVKSLLPRIYMIIEEINKKYCEDLWSNYTNDMNKISEMAIIADGNIRMANLSVVGSHSVNGVANLHTEILKKRELVDLCNFYQNKFNNKTNGITHRRWLVKSNPELSELLIETIGDGFIRDTTKLKLFESFLDNKEVLEKLSKIKKNNKVKLANEIYKTKGIMVDPNSIFDVQVKRIHAYKRQTLNCLRIMDLYNKLLNNPNMDISPRTFIFGGKAAPGYYLAKSTIELINSIADKINNDPRVNKKIKVVLMDNYRVSLAEKIIPATDLSEQISTTTKEASGTSNMKFMMNGAITIATLDGANIEIRDQVKDDNIVIFGLKASEVLDYYNRGNYSSIDIYNSNYELRNVINDLVNGKYSTNKDQFRNIYDNLTVYNDEFFVLRDFEDYIKAQNKVDLMFKNQIDWQKKCGINIANSGVFSSDRTILEYANEIWQ